MLTIIHKTKDVAIVTAHNMDTGTQDLTSWSFMDYTLGFEPPHYPVPAIDCAYIGRYGVYIGCVDVDNPNYPIVLASNI